MHTTPLIVPSVLPCDFSDLGAEVERLTAAGVDRIQWDVMDGHFVPNLTFGPDVIAACRRHTEIGFEAHLMVTDPDADLGRYVDAGCELVIVHAEACRHLHRVLTRIRELGARAGVALNPSTDVGAVAHVLDATDMVLVMTVNPGFGGQAYLSSMEPKIATLRRLIDESGHPVELEVDGGISDVTGARAAAAGADVLVSGTWLVRHADGTAEAVRRLRRAATPPEETR